MDKQKLWIILVISILLTTLTSCNLKQTKHKPKKQALKTTAIYYVSPKGNDKAKGKTKATALKSLRAALKIVKSDGEIRVLPGRYEEQIKVEKAGSRKELKIIGYTGRPIIDGGRKLKIGFWFSKSRNITVEKLEIRNYTDIGIGAESGKNITFKNLIVHDNGFNAQLKDWQIEGYGIDIDNINGYRIENNDVYRNGPKPKKFPDKLLGTGIDTFGSQRGIIRNNKSYKNIGGGILVEDSKHIMVENNRVFKNDLDATKDSWWDGGIWLDGGKDVTIRNNKFYDNIGPGILISDEDKQKPSGYVIKNNVSTNNYFGIYIWNFGVNKWPAKNIILNSKNNFSKNKRKNVVIHAFNYDPKTLR